MKGSIRIIATLLSLSGLMLIIATYNITVTLFASQSYAKISYHFNKKISPESQHLITNFIENNRSMPTQTLLNTLCKEFQYIQKASLKYSPNAIDLYIKPQKLSAVINNQYVMTISGLIDSAHQFTNQCISKLKHLQIPDALITNSQLQTTKTMPSSIHKWIIHTPDTVFDEFLISWFDENNIEYVHKKEPQLVIRCTHEQSLLPSDINACVYAKNQLHTRSLLKNMIVADIRFDRQIIISKR